MDALHLLLSAS